MTLSLHAVLVISYRDFVKFLRDPGRLVGSFIMPVLLILALGGSLQANLGADLGYDFLTFTFTGVLGQTLFMSAAQGVISVIEDRENDFSQEIFVSPISRYAIIFGKIVGETLVALPQGAGILLFGLVIGIRLTVFQILALSVTAVAVCLFGAAFGLLILSNLSSQRVANQLFPFVMLPQWLLAGVFNPIRVLPLYLDIFSRLAPMRYAVDLVRGIFYAGQPEYDLTVLESPFYNLALMASTFVVMLVAGTFLFVRRERNR